MARVSEVKNDPTLQPPPLGVDGLHDVQSLLLLRRFAGRGLRRRRPLRLGDEQRSLAGDDVASGRRWRE